MGKNWRDLRRTSIASPHFVNRAKMSSISNTISHSKATAKSTAKHWRPNAKRSKNNSKSSTANSNRSATRQKRAKTESRKRPRPSTRRKSRSDRLLPEFPLFIEEAGGHDFARVATVRRRGDVDDGVVRQLGDLAGVVEVIVFAEGEAAVEDDVA